MTPGPYRPDRATFAELCARYPVVPVWRDVLADAQTPVAAFARLDPVPNAFLLESVEGGERWARYSFVGGDAFAVVKAKDGRLWTEGAPLVEPAPGEPPLAYVRRLVEELRAPALPGLPPLHGGAVGYLAYEVASRFERLPVPASDELGLPLAIFSFTETVLAFDHLKHRLRVITHLHLDAPDLEAEYRRGQQTIERICARLQEELKGRTLVLITHRPPLLQLVVRIIVIERGKVAADGPRDAVLKQIMRPKAA